METKISRKRDEKMANALGFRGSFALDSVGLSGGIGLFWKKDVVVEVKGCASVKRAIVSYPISNYYLLI
jgi:hypothetical protein